MHFFNMLTRHHECMAITDWTYIEKSDDNLILVDFGRRYLARRYFAENAISHAFKYQVNMCWRGESNPYDLAIAGT